MDMSLIFFIKSIIVNKLLSHAHRAFLRPGLAGPDIDVTFGPVELNRLSVLRKGCIRKCCFLHIDNGADLKKDLM